MAFRCCVCQKGVGTGNNVSHSNRHTRRRYAPNLQKVKVLTSAGAVREYVCTRCLRSGKILKAA
jgi:large subunit ribosomal protein L28